MFWLLRVGEEKDERFSFQDLTTPGAFWQGDDDESNMNRKKNALSSLTTQRLVNAYRVGVPLARWSFFINDASNSFFCVGRHPARRLNPPLPVDVHGNWYRGDVEEDEEAVSAAEEESGSGGAAGVGKDGGLTDAERAILADMEQLWLINISDPKTRPLYPFLFVL
jgi:hypothetical protein